MLQGDGVAERFELPAEVARLAVFVDVGAVVVGSEIVEPRGGVGQQVPDDDQDGSGYGERVSRGSWN